MPQKLNLSRRKHVNLGRLPGAAQLKVAGQLPQRLIIPHDYDRNLLAGAGALQGAMPMWQLEAARRQRQAAGGNESLTEECLFLSFSSRMLYDV